MSIFAARLDDRLTDQMKRDLRRLSFEDPETYERVKKHLVAELQRVRNDIRSEAPGKDSGTNRGVHYKDYAPNGSRFGGAVSILPKRRATEPKRPYYKQETLRTIGKRTIQLYGYTGSDRDFILRFLNAGTDVRMTKIPPRRGRGSRSTWGTRGSLLQNKYRGWFAGKDDKMDKAAENLAKAIEAEFSKMND